MDFLNVVRERRAVKNFDPDHAITDRELQELFSRVVLSPSSFNLQHWRFVVIRDKQRKAELRRAAHDQKQVETASAVIVVLGKLNAHEDAPAVFSGTPESTQTVLLPMISRFYEGKPQLQRDEAIRSASLAAMTLMLGAVDMGYATCPMIGFDPDAVGRLIDLDDQHIPVMLVVMGKPIGDIRPRANRFPPSTVVKIDLLTGAGLP